MPTLQNGPAPELPHDGALVTVIGESLVDIIDDPGEPLGGRRIQVAAP